MALFGHVTVYLTIQQLPCCLPKGRPEINYNQSFTPFSESCGSFNMVKINLYHIVTHINCSLGFDKPATKHGFELCPLDAPLP